METCRHLEARGGERRVSELPVQAFHSDLKSTSVSFVLRSISEEKRREVNEVTALPLTSTAYQTQRKRPPYFVPSLECYREQSPIF